MRSEPAELCSHRGWVRLDGGRPDAEGAWRRGVENRARVADESLDGTVLCIGSHEGALELWEPKADRRAFASDLPNLAHVLALPSGCLVLAGDKVLLVDRTSNMKALVGADARAIGRSAGFALVATTSEVNVFTPAGRLRRRLEVRGVTATGGDGEWLALGLRDGTAQLVSTRTWRAQRLALETPPESPVERLAIGPKSTLVTGHASGELGLWSTESGRRLKSGRLNGRITHLMLRGGWLYAASELGSHLTWDLRVLMRDYCELMREVWRTVPVLWERGLPVRVPPGDHPCSKDAREVTRDARSWPTSP